MKSVQLFVAILGIALSAPAVADCILRQSDAVELTLGPYLDPADFSAETSLTISQGDVILKKCTAAGDCAASAQKNESGACAHDANGMYECDLDTTDTNTVGILEIWSFEAGALPVFRSCLVVEEAVYDAQFVGSAPGPVVMGTNAAAVSFTAGVTISNASGSALTLSSSGSNGSGLATSGNGSGAGITATGGATGNGVNYIGGATSGNGFRAAGTAGNSAALNLVGQGSAAGLLSTGGATGHGISAVGGATSGSGVSAVASTSGSGIVATGVGTTQPGIVATGGSTSSAGISAAGGGTGSGILSTGGATGHGMRLVGGATSGNGISTSVTAPSAGAPELGFAIAGTLSGTHSSTTADLGANAPGTVSDVVGHSLVFPTRHLSRAVTSYDTSEGVATFATIDADITLTNADPWFLFETAPASGGGSAPTAAEVADAVWDEDMTAHQTQGSAGQVIGDSAADSDSIWALANTNLNATISSRASQTSVDAVDDFVDTEVATIVTQTAAASIRTAVGLSSANLDTQLTAIDDYVDTEVATAVTQTTAGSIRTAVGLASANLDTQLTAIDDYVDAEVAAILDDTGSSGVVVAAGSKSGYALSATGLDAITLSEPSAKPVWATGTIKEFLQWLSLPVMNEMRQTSTQKTIRNDANNADLFECAVSDDGTTFTLAECATP